MFKSFPLACFLSLFLVTGCGTSFHQQAKSTLTPQESVYHLGAGDTVKVTVFGEQELSGEFPVDSQGMIAMPLIGKTGITGQTEQEAARTITTDLQKNGFLKNPKVSVETVNMRPFFVMGEVEHGGKYPFQSGLTVYQAVAAAGGYTYRADRDDISIRRQSGKGAGTELRYSGNEDTPVLPGDVIEIGERFF